MDVLNVANVMKLLSRKLQDYRMTVKMKFTLSLKLF